MLTDEKRKKILAELTLPHHYALSREEQFRRLWDEDDMLDFASAAMREVEWLVREECAKIADQCGTGVAIDLVSGTRMILDAMQMSPAAAQKDTADAIAAVIRTSAATGEGE